VNQPETPILISLILPASNVFIDALDAFSIDIFFFPNDAAMEAGRY
jgi:hypothetical protein